VLIADYWLVRRGQLALEDLYLVHGAYRYRGGWNWRAVVATLVGCALAWGGLVVPALKPLYSYAWFVGFFAAALVHWGLSSWRSPYPAAASPLAESASPSGGAPAS
jgi:NCS1 family nucleobase:cation symporter-1